MKCYCNTCGHGPFPIKQFYWNRRCLQLVDGEICTGRFNVKRLEFRDHDENDAYEHERAARELRKPDGDGRAHW